MPMGLLSSKTFRVRRGLQNMSLFCPKGEGAGRPPIGIYDVMSAQHLHDGKQIQGECSVTVVM